MGLIVFLIFGGLIGWVASIIVRKNSQLGIPGNIVVGIVGMFLGNLLLPNDGDKYDVGSFVAGVIGAVILLVLVNLFTSSSKKV